MFSGGVDAQTYIAGDNRMLVALTKGWDGFVARDALLSMSEVLQVEWEGRTYKKDWRDDKDAAIQEADRKIRLKKGKRSKSKSKHRAQKQKQKHTHPNANAGTISASGSTWGSCVRI